MGTESKEREQLKSVYPNATWRAKVKDMSDEQVIAVLRRLQQQGKI